MNNEQELPRQVVLTEKATAIVRASQEARDARRTLSQKLIQLEDILVEVGLAHERPAQHALTSTRDTPP